MDNKSDFFTLKGYNLQEKPSVSFAMEDYLEMIYRMTADQNSPKIHVKQLAQHLNVSVPSVSKMVNKLHHEGFITTAPYKTITLNEKGKILGEYLLRRHNSLMDFFEALTPGENHLRQVEKIEHFIEDDVLLAIEKWLRQIKK